MKFLIRGKVRLNYIVFAGHLSREHTLSCFWRPGREIQRRPRLHSSADNLLSPRLEAPTLENGIHFLLQLHVVVFLFLVWMFTFRCFCLDILSDVPPAEMDHFFAAYDAAHPPAVLVPADKHLVL